MNDDIQAHALARVFAVLRPDLRVEPVPVTPGIYDELDARFDHFKGHVLVSEYAFSEPWPTWERHPAGDEIVILLAGSAQMIVRTKDGERTLALSTPGDHVVVPMGAWHTARPLAPTRMLFVTPGEGTQNAETPDAL